MSYQGYTGVMTSYCSLIKNPTVLEIGVDKGQTALPLIHNLTQLARPFKWVGVDVRMDMSLFEQLFHMIGINIYEMPGPMAGNQSVYHPFTPFAHEWNVGYLHQNSLEAVPDLVQKGWKFDLILIDGDHNYATVKEELNYMVDLSYPTSLIFIDDYSSRWADHDLYYKDRDSHSSNDKLARPESIPGKVGVKQAVDDWISENPDWECCPLVDCAFVKRKENGVLLKMEERFTRDIELHFRPPDFALDRLVPHAADVLRKNPDGVLAIPPIDR